MIEYIANDPQGTIMYQTDGITYHKHSLLHTIDNLCENYLFSYDGYRKAVYHQLKIKHLIPIYLDEDTQLITIKRYRDYDNIFINYQAILSVSEHHQGLIVNFISGREIYIKMSLYSFNQQIEKLVKIRNTKVKHFHRLKDSKCL
jgi:competence transcription factor ComK